MSDRPGEMDERDVDARFASIVAAWDGPAPADTDTDAGESRDAEADDASAAPRPDPDQVPPPASTGSRPPWVNPSPIDHVVVPASSWRVAEPPADSSGTGATAGTGAAAPEDGDDEHFEPPAVALPPQEDLHFWGAVLGLVAGPLCLVYVAMARPFHSTRWFLAGLVLSLGGFALLVLRQPRHRDEDDDGARV